MIKAIGNIAVFIRRAYLIEGLFIILMSILFLSTPSFRCLLDYVADFFSYEWTATKTQRFDCRNNSEFLSFLEENLDIGYNDKGLPSEKKLYYLYNIYPNLNTYSLRFFRRFTLGDGTLEFAERDKEIKAIVFYQNDLEKIKNIKRPIKKIILQDDIYKIYVGGLTVNNSLWQTYRTRGEEDLKFLPSESSEVKKYVITDSKDCRGKVHYIESNKITPSFTANYVFSIKETDILVNPMLPLGVVCDIKSNYWGTSIQGTIGVYSKDGKTLLGRKGVGGVCRPERGVWVKQTCGGRIISISEYFSRGSKDRVYRLEDINIGISHSPRLIGIMLFDD